ncbi:unnamed protein product [Linum trigynum]|uniref:Secreted protein n=1 Tax=Linum trigynum TaxID=586398 RepID=A0AAV2C7C8_9ROSI
MIFSFVLIVMQTGVAVKPPVILTVVSASSLAPHQSPGAPSNTKVVARSSVEAEYKAMAFTISEVLCLR